MRLTRSDFTKVSLGLVGSASLGCATPQKKRDPAPGPSREDPIELGYQPATKQAFPVLSVQGSHYEMGRAIGKRFTKQIRGGFEARGKWFSELRTFVDAQPKTIYETYLAAARKHAPHIVEELRGWSDGSGVPFRDLIILNHKAEFGALRDQKTKRSNEPPPGCSTVAVADAERFILVHNEDGHSAYEQRMFMLRMHPPGGKPSVLCASYPGVLPGNAPWINDVGIIMTTNFIYSKEVRLGVGRYFLDRLAMEARTQSEALRICAHPDRAYAFHHVIGSTTDNRLVSLEVTPTKKSQVEIKGLFLHTNHLVHDKLKEEAQDTDYVSTSSGSRWKVLSAWKSGLKQEPHQLKAADLVSALGSHDGKPYSPCRHPEGDVQGSTLLTAVFAHDLRSRDDPPQKTGMRVYKNQSCLGKDHVFEGP